MVPANKRAPLLGTVTDSVEDAETVTSLSRMLEHDLAAADTALNSITVQVVPPTPEPPVTVLILEAPAPTDTADAATTAADVTAFSPVDGDVTVGVECKKIEEPIGRTRVLKVVGEDLADVTLIAAG